MELTYKNKKLEYSLTEDAKTIRTYGGLAKKIKQRMLALAAAESLATIATLPAMRLHPYKGSRIGVWSIDIHKNWRICFELNHDPIPKLPDGGVNLNLITSIRITSVEDPH